MINAPVSLLARLLGRETFGRLEGTADKDRLILVIEIWALTKTDRDAESHPEKDRDTEAERTSGTRVRTLLRQ